MIVDTHTHFYDTSRPQGVPWPPEHHPTLYRPVLPEHFREVAEPAGVTATVIVEASPLLEDNQWILDLAENDTSIVGLVGHVDPGTEEFQAQIDRFAENPLFRGIRVGAFESGKEMSSELRADFFDNLASKTLLHDFEHLADKDLELDALVGYDHLTGVIEVAQELPQLRIVINHVAQVAIDGNEPSSQWVDAMQRSAAHPNVFCKVSGLMESSFARPAPSEVHYYRPVLNALWESFGGDRLIFGSNWPVCEPAGEYKEAVGIVSTYFKEKGEAALEKVLSGNAKAAYKWVDRS
jgi:L-fuconolactonase